MTNQITPLPSHDLAASFDALSAWEYARLAWLMNFTSEATRRTYRQSLDDFTVKSQLPFPAVTREHVILYREHMTNAGLAKQTINLRLTALSSFYKFAIERGLTDFNPVEKVKRFEVDPYNKATFLDTTSGQDIEFLAAVETNPSEEMRKRDYAMMLVFLTTAIRVGVIPQLRMQNLRLQGRDVYMSYVNKGGTDAEVKLHGATQDALNVYLATRGEVGTDDPVFTATERGRIGIRNLERYWDRPLDQNAPLSPSHVAWLVKKYADIAFGNGHGIHPHSLRHTAALNAAAYASMADLRKLLRHKSMRVTDIYVSKLQDKSDDGRVTSRLDERYRRG